MYEAGNQLQSPCRPSSESELSRTQVCRRSDSRLEWQASRLPGSVRRSRILKPRKPKDARQTTRSDKAVHLALSLNSACLSSTTSFRLPLGLFTVLTHTQAFIDVPFHMPKVRSASQRTHRATLQATRRNGLSQLALYELKLSGVSLRLFPDTWDGRVCFEEPRPSPCRA